MLLCTSVKFHENNCRDCELQSGHNQTYTLSSYHKVLVLLHIDSSLTFVQSFLKIYQTVLTYKYIIVIGIFNGQRALTPKVCKPEL